MYFTTLQPEVVPAGIAIIFLTAAVFIARWVVRWFVNPLRKIPGPRIAILTDIWRLWNALSGREEVINLELHEKYGPIVRAGPAMVYVNDPEPLSQVYRWNRGRCLEAFFKPMKIQMLPGDADMKLHDKYKHAFKPPVSPLAVSSRFNAGESHKLSLPSVLEHEAVIDELVERWFQKLHHKHGQGETCDLSIWIDLLPPDVAAALLWSEPLGLVEKGEDFADIVYGVAKFHSAAVIALVLPWIPNALSTIGLDPIMRRLLKSVKSISFMIELAKSVVTETLEGNGAKNRQDVVQKLVDYRDRDGNGIPRDRLNGEVYGLIMGGSATTASILKMTVVFVATNPRVLNRLVKELDEADEKGLLSPVLQHKETSNLPYLTAILNETLRLRPPQATPLPREVPKGGANICGYYLPEGTYVGISPWSFQARKDLYGEDVRSFRPERWLEDEKQARLLQKSATTFGGGSTYCIGKNVADVEMNKFLAQLFRRYTVIVQDPLQPIRRLSCFAIGYSDLKVKLVARKGKEKLVQSA